MNAVVVDASAIAAVLFDEPEATPIRASVHGRLLAPGLIRYELASVCLAKIRRFPGRAAEIEARHALVDELDLRLHDPQWSELPRLAQRWTLSVYDAAYLQLAMALGAPLVTLDARLARACDAAMGG
jgi:predicted nucleic acid-binding protein